METSNGPTLFQTLGGTAACRRLSVAFYARVARDPLLRPLFPGKSFTCAIEEFTAFLVQFLGGPGEDSQRRWWLSLRESHFRFKIGPAERAAWMKNMVQALDDVPIDESARKALLAFFRHSSQYVVNHPKASPAGNGLDTHEEISRRWEAQIHLDEAVAAIRAGDAVRAVALAGNPVLQLTGRSVPSGLLALMVRKGQSEMLDFVRAKLSHDPALVHGRYNGRTLLHEAAAAGSVTIVELLLHLGADPNVHDGGQHAPLYSLANECAGEQAASVVRALVRAGAAVDACAGVKHCTPLHMAARRGNVTVATALLDCGADIEARDSLGETPLRRAVNCEKPAVASLLLARGANRHSIGSKGNTPLQAARSIAMKRLLQDGAGKEPKR